MSITKMLESEEMQLRANKEYRKGVKERLKEMIEAGDESAAKEYSRLFPKFEFKGKAEEDSQYKSRVLGRELKKIPMIVCKTCGKMTDRVMEYEDPGLINEKRKTWKRVIKPNLSYYLYLNNKKKRNRRLFFSYTMMECIRKKHKLQLKFKAKRTIVEMGYDYARSKA